jgi:hypothetical protein
MKQKNDTPREVTLEKSPSGTWVVPGNTKRQVQPWQRLWFITGIIYLLALSGCYYMLMPNQQSIERRMVFSITEEVKRYEGMAFAGESPAMIFEAAGSHGYAVWIAKLRNKYRIGPEGDAGFERVDKEYRDAISDLPVQRIYGVIICFIAWMIPMTLLYAAGLVVDWIRRSSNSFKKR